jgi:hypothetical protein
LLRLPDCQLDDVLALIQLRILASAAIQSIKVLYINFNRIPSFGLADVTRVLESPTTQLKTFYMSNNNEIFNDEHATHHSVTTLQHECSTLRHLPGIRPHDLPGNDEDDDEDRGIAIFARVSPTV